MFLVLPRTLCSDYWKIFINGYFLLYHRYTWTIILLNAGLIKSFSALPLPCLRSPKKNTIKGVDRPRRPFIKRRKSNNTPRREFNRIIRDLQTKYTNRTTTTKNRRNNSCCTFHEALGERYKTSFATDTAPKHHKSGLV